MSSANELTANNQFLLLKQRRFLPFFLTQALGALNDNIFKNALLIMIAFKGSAELGKYPLCEIS